MVNHGMGPVGEGGHRWVGSGYPRLVAGADGVRVGADAASGTRVPREAVEREGQRIRVVVARRMV